jgi:hypothetical protein
MRKQGRRLCEIKTNLNHLNAGLKLSINPVDFEVLVERVTRAVKGKFTVFSIIQ